MEPAKLFIIRELVAVGRLLGVRAHIYRSGAEVPVRGLGNLPIEPSFMRFTSGCVPDSSEPDGEKLSLGFRMRGIETLVALSDAASVGSVYCDHIDFDLRVVTQQLYGQDGTRSPWRS
jgi:hypothetical protein